VIVVLSGKGGVGKSTVATQLALSLANRGKRVGLLDVDLCGPSVPKILGLTNHKVHQSTQGWVPVYVDEEKRLAVMSIGFLLANPDDAVVWRGPKKNAMIKQFLTDVVWGEIEYLIVDTPPGTSDEHISLVEGIREMNPDGAVLVTTPQAISVADVRREWTFCKKANLNVLGVVENMSGYVCPHCSECTNIFSSGGGEWLAQYAGIPFLGRIPLEPNLTVCMERGEDYAKTYPDSSAAKVIGEIVDKLM